MAEMSEFDKKLLEEVDYLKTNYFTFDKPIPFCGLMLYPVQITDYYDFMQCSSCFLLNRLDEVAGIRTTDLGYLLLKMRDEKDGQIWSSKFSRLIELCTHVSPGCKCGKCGKKISYMDYYAKYVEAAQSQDVSKLNCECGENDWIPSIQYKMDEETKKEYLLIDNNKVTSDDFRKLRRYVLYQNMPDYKDDSWVDKAIRDDQKARAELEGRDSATATLEDQIIAVMNVCSLSLDDVCRLSMRKFNLLFKSVVDLMEYEPTKIGLSSGMITLKDGQSLDHWVYKKKKGLYKAAVDSEALANKIKSL